MLDILSFDNDLVKKLLIDTMRIEGTVIVRERTDGDKLMKNNQPAITEIVACMSANCYRLGGT